jgi:hypothetical protein
MGWYKFLYNQGKQDKQGDYGAGSYDSGEGLMRLPMREVLENSSPNQMTGRTLVVGPGKFVLHHWSK